MLTPVNSHPGSGSGWARICAWVWCPAQEQSRAYKGMLGACSPIGTSWTESWRVEDFPPAVLLWVVAASSGTVISSRKDFQTGKGRYTKADQIHEDQCFGPGASALYLEECCAARGNNSVSVLCSSYECIRNFFTAEGRAPRQMQEACAGEVRSAASYPTPFSPLWADRVARSVTKRKWCGSLNWQERNFFFFFFGQDCTCSLQQACFCWKADVTSLSCEASPHSSSFSPGGVLRRGRPCAAPKGTRFLSLRSWQVLSADTGLSTP